MSKSEKISKHTTYNGEEYLEKAIKRAEFPNSTAAVRLWMSYRLYIKFLFSEKTLFCCFLRKNPQVCNF
jgi:hypothetical protein